MQNGMEQFVAAQRAALDTAHNIGLKAIEGLSQLFELNVQATRTAIADTTSQMKALFDVEVLRIADKGFAFQSPSAEKLMAYVQQAYEIVSTTNSEIAELLQKHVEEAQEFAVEAIDNAAKYAPVGSESVFTAAKSSLGAARNAYEQAVNASKQVSEIAERNATTVAKIGSHTAKKTSDVTVPSITVTAAA